MRSPLALIALLALAGCARSFTARIDGGAVVDAGVSDADAGSDANALDADTAVDAAMPACVPEPERCNGRDDDCDDVVDEEPEASTWCGARCGVEMCPHARPLMPLSGGLVTTRRPTFRWVLEGGADAAQVEICLDRACDDVVMRIEGETDARPDDDLPRGFVFWRLVPRRAGAALPAVSPAWPLFIPSVGWSDRDTWLEQRFDFNCDGYVDRVVERYDGRAMTQWSSMLLGGPAGFVESARIGEYHVSGSWSIGGVRPIGDVDGDGCSDLGWGRRTSAGEWYQLAFGNPSGVPTLGPLIEDPVVDQWYGFQAAGDVDGDGYADQLVRLAHDERAYFVLRGGPRERLGTEWLAVPLSASDEVLMGVFVAGDLNGDGRGDLLERHHPHMWSTLGGEAFAAPVPFGPAPPRGGYTPELRAIGDVDGDGVPDLAALDLGRYPLDRDAWTLRSRETTSDAGAEIWVPIADASTSPTLTTPACDVDGDGFGDLVFESYSVELTPILRRGGAMGPVEDIPLPRAVSGSFYAFIRDSDDAVCLGDPDRDGFQDMLIGTRGGELVMLRGNAYGFDPTPIFTLATSTP